jgi:chromosome segregation ATPase
MNTLNECQAAIQAAQKRVDELLDAQKFLDAEREVARLALRSAHANLQQLKATDQRLRIQGRQADLAALRTRIAEAGEQP